MKIVPAVDIRGGLCVNLIQGDYGKETVFSEDPVDQAMQWRDQGAALVHIVDLDGAKAGHCCIEDELRAMTQANLSIEVGGGIRDMDTVSKLIDLGVTRVVLGTAAHEDPDFLNESVAQYGDHIAVGIDGNNGKVALSGWLDVTETSSVEFAKKMQSAGVERIIYTDILSDGMMKGPNIAATRELAQGISIPVTASGGMSALTDIEKVKELETHGVDEVIIGRALYLDIFTLPQAITAAK